VKARYPQPFVACGTRDFAVFLRLTNIGIEYYNLQLKYLINEFLLMNEIKFCTVGISRSVDENINLIIVSTASGFQTFYDRVHPFIQNFY
jgi:hypothetical protein